MVGTLGVEPVRWIDSRGKPCPLPIVDLARAARTAFEGELLGLLATDPAAVPDVRAWCASTGHTLLTVEQQEGLVTARVRVRGGGNR